MRFIILRSLMDKTIEEKIRVLMAVVFEVPGEEIHAESSSETIESWDSLKHMNLVVALEEEFGIIFDDDEIIQMLNFALIALIVKEKST